MTGPVVVVAGATGYLGRYLVSELAARGYRVRALVRDPAGLGQAGAALAPPVGELVSETWTADLTQPESLAGIAAGAEAVCSTVSLMGDKSRHSWHEVDYLGNLNLLREAQASGVRRFLYLSSFKADRMLDIPMVRAHEDFARELAASDLLYSVVRPTGYFSDLSTYLKMARSGRAYLLGNGSAQLNPIHGADLARVCAEALETGGQIDVGGPEVLTQRRMAELAFESLGMKPRVTAIPLPLARAALALVGLVRPKTAALGRFFVAGAATDLVAPVAGHRRLGDFFAELAAAVP